MDKKILEIINHYGVKNQLKKLSEEIYELQEAILLNDSREHIVEEFADVNVLLEQIMVFYDLKPEDLLEVMKYKVNRQLGRIANE